jgi:hypothetical protein
VEFVALIRTEVETLLLQALLAPVGEAEAEFGNSLAIRMDHWPNGDAPRTGALVVSGFLPPMAVVDGSDLFGLGC